MNNIIYTVTIFGIQVYVDWVKFIAWGEAECDKFAESQYKLNLYPKNMSPCNDFITYFFVDKINIITRLSLPIRYGILQRE